MNDNQKQFLAMAIPAAKACMKTTGIPASITIAQAILESSNKKGWGKSRLAVECNNFFGIKANKEQIANHQYQEFPTYEVEHGVQKLITDEFAKYASPEECFIAHGQLLLKPWYAKAVAVKDDPDKFAWALGPKSPEHPEGCGYSTSPLYHDSLMKIVRIYNLTQYDKVEK